MNKLKVKVDCRPAVGHQEEKVVGLRPVELFSCRIVSLGTVYSSCWCLLCGHCACTSKRVRQYKALHTLYLVKETYCLHCIHAYDKDSIREFCASVFALN